MTTYIKKPDEYVFVQHSGSPGDLKTAFFNSVPNLIWFGPLYRFTQDVGSSDVTVTTGETSVTVTQGSWLGINRHDRSDLVVVDTAGLAERFEELP